KKIAEVLKPEFSGGVLWAYLGYDFGESILKQTLIEWVAAHPQGKNIQSEDVTPALIQNLLRTADGKLLVVIDDVWSRETFHELVKILPSHKVVMLITTQDKNIYDLSISNLNLFELHHLNPEDAYNLLTAQIEKFDKYIEELKQTTFLLGYHVLALKIASAWLVRNSVHNISVLIASLQDSDLTAPFAELNLGDTRDNNLEKAFSLSYTSLDDDHKLYFRKLAAVPMGLRFTSEIAFAIWGIETENRGDSLKSQKYLRALVDAALVERNEDGSYQLHFNLHAYAAALMIRQSNKEHDEYSQTRTKYYGRAFGMVCVFGELSPEEWSAKASDIPHFHALGAMLLHQVRDWLEKNSFDVEMLSQLDLSFSLQSVLDDNDRGWFEMASDFVSSLGNYIKS
ncbi:NB-ARC domain-containing protein, partial [bacterium]|nr:NB-ARC domain-containing protein [bacterium]